MKTQWNRIYEPSTLKFIHTNQVRCCVSAALEDVRQPTLKCRLSPVCWSFCHLHSPLVTPGKNIEWSALIVKFVTEYNIKHHRQLEVNISNPFTAERKQISRKQMSLHSAVYCTINCDRGNVKAAASVPSGIKKRWVQWIISLVGVCVVSAL